MAKQWLLKLERHDDDESYVLVRVTAKDSDDLDLDFLATEGEEVYKGKLRKNDLKVLRAKTYSGTDDEWEAILRYTLLDQKPSSISREQKQSLEVGVSRQDQKGKPLLSIAFRNRIDDITQRIGAIELSHTSKEIQLFDWAALAVDKAQALQTEFSALSEKTNEDKSTIARLESELADLVKAKADHEEQMLLKFVFLLNEKKAKIRDQQRILQTATLDEGRKKQLQALQGASSSRNRRRRTTKRGASEDGDSEDESQAFETQEDRRGKPNGEDAEMDTDRQTTPSTTASEADDEDIGMRTRAKKLSPRKASPRSTKKSAPTRGSPPRLRSQHTPAKSSHNSRSETKAKTPEPAPIDDDEETASEDDEL